MPCTALAASETPSSACWRLETQNTPARVGRNGGSWSPGTGRGRLPYSAHLTSVRVVPGGWSPLSTKRSRLLFRTVKWALVIESLAEIGAVLLKRQSEVIARCVAKGLLDAEVDFGRYHGSVSEG